MTDSEDDEFIAYIAPDVLKRLQKDRFFEKLDDLLCPTDGSQGARCEANFRVSQSVLESTGFTSENISEILEVLKSQGGCCDCEVLYNVAETSRLKANYWRSQAKNLKDDTDRDSEN